MKRTKGISLIVLIVTIIVMIIIAGAIIISLSQTNVIDQAETAVQNHNEASEKDILTLAWGEYMASSITNPAAELKVEGATVTGNSTNGWTVIFTSGSKYTVSAKGQITKDGAQEVEETNWKYAWTSDGVTWSDTYYRDSLPEGTKLEGKIIAKIYEVDEVIPASILENDWQEEAFDLPAANGYILDIQGSGELPELYKEIGEDKESTTIYSGWFKDFEKYLYGESDDAIMPYIVKVIIGEGIINIPDIMLAGCGSSLREIDISNTVEIIGSGAFQNAGNLSKVIIPNSVKIIGQGAFRNCDNLAEVIIGNSVEQIETSAFEYCKNLKSIIIPASVQLISKTAFGSCSNLENVYIERTENDITIGYEAFSAIAPNAIIYVRNNAIANIVRGEISNQTIVSSDYNWVAPIN